MGTIIAVANQKGGVGKTTGTVNLAHLFSSKGKRVLLIDNDPQGNATSCFTLDRPADYSNTLTLYCFNQDEPIAPIVVKDTLHLLGTTDALTTVAECSYEVVFDFRTRINSLREWYDIVLIDCLPSFGYLFNAALISADFLLTPTELDAFALDGLAALMQNIERTRKRHNPNLKLLGIYANRTHKIRTNIEQEVFEELLSLYGPLLFEISITQSKFIPESNAKLISVTDHAPNSQQAEQYAQLADEILARIKRLAPSMLTKITEDVA